MQENLSPPHPARKVLLTLLRLAVGLGLLVYLAQSRVINLPALLSLFTAWPITFAACALLLFDVFLMALRLSWLFRPQGLHLSLKMSLQLTLVGFFFSVFLPGAAGGDLAPVVRVAQDVVQLGQQIGWAGRWEVGDSPLRGAPHTARSVVGEWEHPYSRDVAVYPAGVDPTSKYWSPVRRIDGAFGDRNLMCSCPPVEDYS